MLVIIISTIPSERSKLENAYEEIAARHAPILLISYENIRGCPYFIQVSKHSFAYLDANVVLQMLSLHLSLGKGLNPDFPRHLAKTVTVL